VKILRPNWRSPVKEQRKKKAQVPRPTFQPRAAKKPEGLEAKLPSTVHVGGFFSWGFSKKAQRKYLGSRTSGRDRHADLEKLTKTERRVYPMLEDALTNKQIAEKLGVSEETARTHVRHILTKLHLKSRSKLVKS
jgi:DNA-binding CsgD family transcriptional regulator